MTVITHTPDVLGGRPRIEGTRIGVLHVYEMVREADYSIEETAHQLDISEEDVRRALEFYDSRPEEMSKWKAENNEILQKSLIVED